MTTSRKRTRGRTGYRSGPRRAVEWFDTFINETTSSGTQDNQDLTSGIVADERKGMTLVRTIIDLTCLLSAVGTGGLVHMGIFELQSDAAGALALPDVNDSDEAGWIWRVGPRVISATNLNDVSMNSRFIADLRGQRKLTSEDHGLHFIFNAGTLTSDVNTDGLIRLLFKKA